MNSLNIRNIMWIAGLLFVGACSGGKDPWNQIPIP